MARNVPDRANKLAVTTTSVTAASRIRISPYGRARHEETQVAHLCLVDLQHGRDSSALPEALVNVSKHCKLSYRGALSSVNARWSFGVGFG